MNEDQPVKFRNSVELELWKKVYLMSLRRDLGDPAFCADGAVEALRERIWYHPAMFVGIESCGGMVGPCENSAPVRGERGEYRCSVCAKLWPRIVRSEDE